MQMNDFEGTPPYPLDVDDEYLLPSSRYPSSHHPFSSSLTPQQPAHLPSYMSGFLSILKLYKIMSECLFRQRTITRGVVPETDRAGVLEWVEEMMGYIKVMVGELPASVASFKRDTKTKTRRNNAIGGARGGRMKVARKSGSARVRYDDASLREAKDSANDDDDQQESSSDTDTEDTDEEEVLARKARFGMQSANVLVTSVIVRFALVSPSLFLLWFILFFWLCLCFFFRFCLVCLLSSSFWALPRLLVSRFFFSPFFSFFFNGFSLPLFLGCDLAFGAFRLCRSWSSVFGLFSSWRFIISPPPLVPFLFFPWLRPWLFTASNVFHRRPNRSTLASVVVVRHGQMLVMAGRLGERGCRWAMSFLLMTPFFFLLFPFRSDGDYSNIGARPAGMTWDSTG